jgi:hypothetical protein
MPAGVENARGDTDDGGPNTLIAIADSGTEHDLEVDATTAGAG